MLLLLLVSSFALSTAAKSNQFPFQFTPGCREYCSYVPPQDNLYISGNVLKPLLKMSFERICDSLTNRNCQKLEERKFTSIDVNRKVLKTSIGEICDIVIESELNPTEESEDDTNIILSQIKDHTVEEICNDYSNQFNCVQRNSRLRNHYSTFCTSVCVSGFDEDLENTVLKGAYLKNLRRDSLRKNCKYLLSSRAVSRLDDAFQSVRSTRSLVNWLTMETEMAHKKMEYAVDKYDKLKSSKQEKLSDLKSALENMEAKDSEDEISEARSSVYKAETDVFLKNDLLERMYSMKDKVQSELQKLEEDLEDSKAEADRALREKESLDSVTSEYLQSMNDLDF